MIKCGPVWGQLETHTVLNCIEKPLLFLRFFFFTISRESLKACGNAFGKPLGRLGEPLGSPGEALETLWEALGAPWEALGAPWGRLGTALEDLFCKTWTTTWNDLPESTSGAKTFSPITL